MINSSTPYFPSKGNVINKSPASASIQMEAGLTVREELAARFYAAAVACNNSAVYNAELISIDNAFKRADLFINEMNKRR